MARAALEPGKTFQDVRPWSTASPRRSLPRRAFSRCRTSASSSEGSSMHAHDLSQWRHEHVFDTGNETGERSTRLVTWMTAAMMVAEIAAGWYYNSMALGKGAAGPRDGPPGWW